MVAGEGKMLGNISDCVKKIFVYFTASLILAWIPINTYQPDMNVSAFIPHKCALIHIRLRCLHGDPG